MRRILAIALMIWPTVACAHPPQGSESRAVPPAPGTSITPAPAASSSPGAEPPTATEPRFSGSIAVIDDATRARMRSSWRAGCPVPIEHLRLLRLDHWGFDRRVNRGELVVHSDVAAAVVRVFGELFAAGFPIERMRLVDEYGGDDDRSMAADNTSGFNCRRSSGAAAFWSEHSYGRAIDVNPVRNPSVGSAGVEPEAGERYLDRTQNHPGMIHDGDVVVRAFANVGWSWGGAWSRSKDYQHFSQNGR
jgi:D-alanyl-D-alanine carboxypeptidase-like protein